MNPLAAAAKKLIDKGFSAEEAADFLTLMEEAARHSLTAVVRAVIEYGKSIPDATTGELVIIAVEAVEGPLRVPPTVRGLYQRAPRTKPYGPASDPKEYQSDEKRRAFAFAESFVLGAPNARLPEREWWPLVGRVRRRDNFTCTYCGAGDEYVLQCDHIVPISRGGPNIIENLTTACDYCNSAKRDRLPQEWLS